MEKPDANGFVNITWPSRNVPHGGIFHTRVVEPSEKNREFLKVLLEESKLSIAQRQQASLEARLRADEQAARPAPSQPRTLVRPKTSRRRSLSAIREVTALDDECYRPPRRGEDRERLKDRLAHSMAYGDTEQVPAPLKPPPRLLKKQPELPSKKQMRNELLTQIRERAEWLAEMEVLGEAAAHEDIIKDQIAERLRALDAMGVDSICSSARSSASGFSTLRSTERASVAGSVKSGRSSGSQGQVQKGKSSGRKKEENVAAYNHPPLQYSPRRRC